MQKGFSKGSKQTPTEAHPSVPPGIVFIKFLPPRGGALSLGLEGLQHGKKRTYASGNCKEIPPVRAFDLFVSSCNIPVLHSFP